MKMMPMIDAGHSREIKLGEFIKLIYSSVFEKCSQQDQRVIKMCGVSWEMWISSSISAILFTLRSRSLTVGRRGEFQCLGRQSLAALIICIAIDLWYCLQGICDICNRNRAGSRSRSIDVMDEVIHLTVFQKGWIFGQDHQKCNIVPLSKWDRMPDLLHIKFCVVDQVCDTKETVP